MTTAIILLLAGLGVPLFAIILLSALTMYSAAGIDPTNIFIAMADLMTKPFLIPIPLFTIAGFLLANSSSPKRIVRFTEAWFSPIPGGLAMVAILTLTIFTAFTGASGVTIVALGGLLMPILLEKGYPENMALGTITSSGSLGLLFFPSLPVFILSTVYSLSSPSAPLSPDRIFLGGLLPGSILVLFFIGYAYYFGKKTDSVIVGTFNAAEAKKSFRPVIGELLIGPLILGLLQTGTISLNEISLVIVTYIFILSVVIRKDINIFKDLPKILTESMSLVGAITLILSVVLGMNNYLIQEEIPNKILDVLQGFVTNKWVFLFFLNVFLLIVGCLMDVFSATLAVLPLLIPLANEYGIEPVHLAIVFLANLEVGFLTPPVGMNLFISSFHFKKPVIQIYKSVVVFIVLLLIALMTITYVPAISTFIPDAVLGKQQIIKFDFDEEKEFGGSGANEDYDLGDGSLGTESVNGDLSGDLSGSDGDLTGGDGDLSGGSDGDLSGGEIDFDDEGQDLNGELE